MLIFVIINFCRHKRSSSSPPTRPQIHDDVKYAVHNNDNDYATTSNHLHAVKYEIHVVHNYPARPNHSLLQQEDL